METSGSQESYDDHGFSCPSIIYEQDHCSSIIELKVQILEELYHQLEEKCHKLEEILKTLKFSSIGHMQNLYGSTSNVNSHCNEEFQCQSIMSSSNERISVEALNFNSLSNNAWKNCTDCQSDLFKPCDSSTSSMQVKCNPMDKLKGRIYNLAKDEQGYKILRRKFVEGSLEDSNKIFGEIVNHVVELMTDPFGNLLMETVIEVCNTTQRSKIVHELTINRWSLIEVSCHEHGTRPAQKLIETLETNEQVNRIISALSHCIVYLMKNAIGKNVVESCLKHFSAGQNEFLFDAALSHCVDIATNKHGCFILQKCIICFDVYQGTRLIRQISRYALHLAQDRFGNFLVQFLFELRIPWVTAAVLDNLQGNYVGLLMNKCSSYVVEKCIKCAGEGYIGEIVREIMASPLFYRVLIDEFGNFPIQRALERTKGQARADLVAAIMCYAPALRSHPFGKKVLWCIYYGLRRS